MVAFPDRQLHGKATGAGCYLDGSFAVSIMAMGKRGRRLWTHVAALTQAMMFARVGLFDWPTLAYWRLRFLPCAPLRPMTEMCVPGSSGIARRLGHLAALHLHLAAVM